MLYKKQAWCYIMDRRNLTSDVRLSHRIKKATRCDSWLFLFLLLYKERLNSLGWLPSISIQPFANVMCDYTADDRDH